MAQLEPLWVSATGQLVAAIATVTLAVYYSHLTNAELFNRTAEFQERGATWDTRDPEEPMRTFKVSIANVRGHPTSIERVVLMDGEKQIDECDIWLGGPGAWLPPLEAGISVPAGEAVTFTAAPRDFDGEGRIGQPHVRVDPVLGSNAAIMPIE